MSRSFTVGTLVGLLLAFAGTLGPAWLAGPLPLGAMFFMKPNWPETLLAPLLHLGLGLAIGVIALMAPTIRIRTAVLAAVAINAAATLLDSGGAGVMGVFWWAFGTVVSAAIMLLAAHLVLRISAALGGTRRGSRAG